MSEKTELKPCPRCESGVSIIRAHGAKWVSCRCGIQSSRYGEHIDDERMIADWNARPIEDAQAARIAELEEALVKAMVRGDYIGDFVNGMSLSDDDQSAMLAATDSLYDDLELVIQTIPGYKERYREENDAAYARAEKAKKEDDAVELHCAICEKPLFNQRYVWDTDRGYCCTACIKALKSKTEKN